jgi:hypothetical protein
MDPTLQQQLLDLYDSYNKALAAGKLPDAMTFRSAAVRTEAQKELKTAKDRQDFLLMAKMTAPDKMTVQHASTNAAGDKAAIVTIASKTFPPGKRVPGGPPPGTTAQSEMTLHFVREADAWKLDELDFGLDPAKIVACKNDKFEPESAYDENKTVSMGGPIARVDFQPTYTLVVVRVVDEETCAFVRGSQADLLKHGLDPAKLQPYAIVEIEGSPHKTDKQKVLIESLTVQPED